MDLTFREARLRRQYGSRLRAREWQRADPCLLEFASFLASKAFKVPAIGTQVLGSVSHAANQSHLFRHFVCGVRLASSAKINLQRNARQIRRSLSVGAGTVPKESSQSLRNAYRNSLRSHSVRHYSTNVGQSGNRKDGFSPSANESNHRPCESSADYRRR
jgi:hypothetical protein